MDLPRYWPSSQSPNDPRPPGSRPARVPVGELADVLEEVGRAVPEELVRDDLIAELRNG
jgi:hypothetical protein